ncbi:MAG: hypothetical protein PHD58_03950 [Anaerolineales bacterium]|nr:hypothetical protein [Anaerolineales bacterium]
MTRRILFAVLLALLLSAFDSDRRIQLTIVNKADIDLGIMLRSKKYDERFYYLTVPKAKEDEEFTEKTFEIIQDEYLMQVYYMKPYDPVYPNKCIPSLRNVLFANRNIRLVFLPCNQMPPDRGEPTMLKFWFWRPWKFKYNPIY